MIASNDILSNPAHAAGADYMALPAASDIAVVMKSSEFGLSAVARNASSAAVL